MHQHALGTANTVPNSEPDPLSPKEAQFHQTLRASDNQDHTGRKSGPSSVPRTAIQADTAAAHPFAPR